MRRLVCIAALVLAAIAHAAPPAPAVVRDHGRIRVALPKALLAEAEVRKGLQSGLTTTFILTADAGERRGGARIELRYELWDEVYLARAVSVDGREEKASLPSLGALEQWWSTPRLTVLTTDTSELQLKLEVLPFSASEEADAKRWLAQATRSSAPPAGTSAGTSAAVASSASLLDAIIGTSVRRKPLLSYVWRYRL